MFSFASKKFSQEHLGNRQKVKEENSAFDYTVSKNVASENPSPFMNATYILFRFLYELYEYLQIPKYFIWKCVPPIFFVSFRQKNFYPNQTGFSENLTKYIVILI